MKLPSEMAEKVAGLLSQSDAFHEPVHGATLSFDIFYDHQEDYLMSRRDTLTRYKSVRQQFPLCQQSVSQTSHYHDYHHRAFSVQRRHRLILP